VVLVFVGAGLLLSMAGLAAYRSPSLGWAAILLAAVVFAVERSLAKRRRLR
jgi:hypothetical protein